MIFDRFCLQILPEIHDKTTRLDLESSTMKHVLRAVAYPNLHVLGLYNIDEESIRCLFTGKLFLFKANGRFITTLFIAIDKNFESYDDMLSSAAKIFDGILTVLTRLNALALRESSYKNCVRLRFNDSLHLTFHSSTLLTSNVNLLQGDIRNLKNFSLSCDFRTSDCNEAILPLLYRMSNLEQLGLYLLVYVEQAFIDGNHLKRNIINRMSRLNQFTFSIISHMYIRNKLNLPSTKDIQHTFIGFPTNEIISYVDYFPEAEQGQCHIFSYPFLMERYPDITNNFPGGLFQYVRVVSLFDEHPFGHEFFVRIQKSFPFLEELYLTNHKSQNRKQFYESSSDNPNLSVIQYSFLTKLVIDDDYIEQFLFDTKMYLKKYNYFVFRMNLYHE
ncbi:unnamed protein product [Rotaria socialis]|uniref:Uncharacterized protein n=1 Tax=Rotaria socialis TaxID=392032 RepID=A0A817LUC5_9BILA|nr:unnamed protein product [Rotaria socialis]CAF4223669.1 unnamed protein product [Rotaria socialis]